MEDRGAVIIAMTGKGGVGKTSLAAIMVGELVREFPGKRILAIDADPAVGLSTALGVEVETTVDDIRREFVSTVEGGDSRSALELLGDARFRLFDALVEAEGFSFLAIGRPEAAGCYCKVNSYLKDVISVLSSNFDYIVIDGEAGIEQVNRRVMEKVTHLVLVTDASRKGVQVIHTIRDVARDLVMYERAGAILNRLPASAMERGVDIGDIPVLAAIPADDALAGLDIEGSSVLELPDGSPVRAGVRRALCGLGILKEE